MGLMNGLRGAVAGAGRARAARQEREAASTGGQALPDGAMFCTACGHAGVPESNTPGSLLIEIVLWCFFLVPGLVYSLWRHAKRHPACAKCGSAALIPPDSPVARAAMARLQ